MKHALHMGLLFVETTALLAAFLFPVFADTGHGHLFHCHGIGIILMLALGIASVVMAAVVKVMLRRIDGPSPIRGRSRLALTLSLVLVGVVLLVRGFSLALYEYPEVFRFGAATPDAGSRLNSLNGVCVLFDASEGVCDDTMRIVRADGTYGCTMNVYPSEDVGYFEHFNYCRLNIPRGKLRLSVNNTGKTHIDAHYFVTNAVACVSSNETWTYVVDVDHFSGQMSAWVVGQSWKTNGNAFVRLERGNVGTDVKSGDRKFLYLKNNLWPSCNYLDRGVLVAQPGQSFDISFQVSLFAGTAVNASNYRYVRPGETLACPLPVPTRDGYAFEGWYDGERRIDESTQVVRKTNHVLRAKWRKD